MSRSQGSTSLRLHYVVGVGEGTDNMDFLADLSALKIIEPEEVTKARPDNSKPVPRSESVLLQKLKQGEVPYAHCAWCEEALPTRIEKAVTAIQRFHLDLPKK